MDNKTQSSLFSSFFTTFYRSNRFGRVEFWPYYFLPSGWKTKPNTIFKLPLPSHNDIAEIIKKAKSSYSVGNDIINMNIIKKLTPLIIPHITHLLTNIIISEKYPTILKTLEFLHPLKVKNHLKILIPTVLSATYP